MTKRLLVFWFAIAAILVYGFLDRTPPPPQTAIAPAPHAPTAEERIQAWAPAFDEILAVSGCDLAANRLVLSPASFSTGWRGWTILEHPESKRVTILRTFDAANVFGALLRGEYRCLIDPIENQIVEITITP